MSLSGETSVLRYDCNMKTEARTTGEKGFLVVLLSLFSISSYEALEREWILDGVE